MPAPAVLSLHGEGFTPAWHVYLPPELVRAVKHAAVDEGMSLSKLVEHALRNYLALLAEQYATGTG